MPTTPKTILTEIEPELAGANSATGIKAFLRLLVQKIQKVYLAGRDDVAVLEAKDDGVVATGWFDDGANFRVTVTQGRITAIEDSSGGGHS